MDCSMPIMDGFEATEKILEFHKLRGDKILPRIIGVTGHAEMSYKLKGKQKG